MPALILFIVNCIISNPSVPENDLGDFGDLGNLLLGGFVLAVAIAVLFTFIRLRLREKNPPPERFISISDFGEKK